MRHRPARAPGPPTLLSVAVLAMAGMAGCAASGASLLELHPWTPPPGQSCDVPAAAPALPTLADSGTVADAVARLRPTDGALLLSVWAPIGREGGARTAHIVDTTLPADEARDLTAELDGSYPAGVGGGRVLVEVVDGRLAGLTVGPSQMCIPAMANTREVRRELDAVGRRFRQRATARLALYVDSTGVVTEMELKEGSGATGMDLPIIEVAHGAVFHPALIDRRPVPVWVVLDFSVDVSCGSLRSPPGRADPCPGR